LKRDNFLSKRARLGGTDSKQVRDGMAEFLQQHGQRVWIPAFNGVLHMAKQLLGARHDSNHPNFTTNGQ